MRFPKFNWTLSRPIPEEQNNPVVLLRTWHRAFLLGFRIRKLSVNGINVSLGELDRLNSWIAAYGAWRCSSLPHWEALGAIDNALHGLAAQIRVGKAGGGRVGHLVESHSEPQKLATVKPVKLTNTLPPRKRGRRRKPLEGKAGAEEMAAFDRSLRFI